MRSNQNILQIISYTYGGIDVSSNKYGNNRTRCFVAGIGTILERDTNRKVKFKFDAPNAVNGSGNDRKNCDWCIWRVEMPDGNTDVEYKRIWDHVHSGWLVSAGTLRRADKCPIYRFIHCNNCDTVGPLYAPYWKTPISDRTWWSGQCDGPLEDTFEQTSEEKCSLAKSKKKSKKKKSKKKGQ